MVVPKGIVNIMDIRQLLLYTKDRLNFVSSHDSDNLLPLEDLINIEVRPP